MVSEINDIIKDLNEGKIICLADNPDLENEIDMVCLGLSATPENINYMITNARGLVCCPMSAEWIDDIGLNPMREKNEDKRGTPFYESVDLEISKTGISAIERSETVQRLNSNDCERKDFISPGHLFTLRAAQKLLDERQGHTEGSVALAKLCGQNPVAVICEIIKDNGEMLRVSDFKQWNEGKNLKLTTIEKIKEYIGNK